MNIIYYNKQSGTFCEFEISDIDETKVSQDNIVEDIIEHSLSEIAKWGHTQEFPENLLEALNDDEVDSFLLSAFNKKIKRDLGERLYALIEPENMKTFLEIDTQEIVGSEAIGRNSIILYKEKANEIISAASVTFEDLDEKFIQI